MNEIYEQLLGLDLIVPSLGVYIGSDEIDKMMDNLNIYPIGCSLDWDLFTLNLNNEQICFNNKIWGEFINMGDSIIYYLFK